MFWLEPDHLQAAGGFFDNDTAATAQENFFAPINSQYSLIGVVTEADRDLTVRLGDVAAIMQGVGTDRRD